MLYISLALAISCVALGGIVLAQRKRLRHTISAHRQLSAVVDDITELTKQAEHGQDSPARSEDPDLRCWGTSGTFCADSEKQGLFEKIEDCEGCEVYAHALADVVPKVTQLFNRLLAMRQRDAAHLAEMKRHVQRANKLASLGEFAAGIAHEIHNPLDGILSCVARLERDPANLTQNMEYLKLIHDALDRMSLSIHHLLEYSQKRDLHVESTDIHAVIENVVGLIATSARRNAVDIEFECDDAVPPIVGDKYHLEQAFLNLALNAMAATAEGGTLTFRTAMNGSGAGSGRFVEVDVIDNGVGVDPVNLDKIFDPFFTTKEPGEGTGLGLVIVKSIIEEHGGNITIESALGEGTTVRVFLPVDEENSQFANAGEGGVPGQ